LPGCWAGKEFAGAARPLQAAIYYVAMPISDLALRTVHVTRYITPLREGGSLPALVEADDGFMYVVKFRGAGQGIKVLVAELIVGE
jgi:hypothetical protein